MKRYKYKAKDKNGQVITGEVEAANQPHAAKLIRDRDLILITLRPIYELPFNFTKRISQRVTGADVNTFTRQLATMVNAGLPLTEALLILRTQTKGTMQKIVSKILADVEEGESCDINFFGRSFIADESGTKVAEADRKEETVLTVSFDFEEIRKRRNGFSLFRDRRPEMYDVLLTLDGRVS